VGAAIAFSISDLVGMTVDRHTQPGCATAVVGVSVPKYHSSQPSKRRRSRSDPLGHCTDASVVGQDAAAISDEVNVHNLVRESTAHHPDTLRNWLDRTHHQPPHETAFALSPLATTRILANKMVH
jgi:hypothetical protein